MGPDQLAGVISNTKGVLHEMEFVELENADGDSVYASLFPATNNPGYDVEFVDRSTGATWDAQLKATDEASYVEDWIEHHPDGEILVTDEMADHLGLESSGFSNHDLTVQTTDLVDHLVNSDDDDVWDYVPGLGTVSISLIIWELLQRLKRGEISAPRFRQLVARAVGRKAVKIAGLSFLLTIPGINIVTGAAMVFKLVFSTASLAKRVDAFGIGGRGERANRPAHFVRKPSSPRA